MSKDVFIYRIDSTDTLISVSDNWNWFADANAWGGCLRPEGVVGHKLWEFIQDIETRHLYKELFRRVRGGKLLRTIPFRCDSPNERRYLELCIESLPDEQIQMTSKILRTEVRDPVKLLDADTPRTTDLVTVCSMCKKIKVSQDIWVEIDEGVTHLRLFDVDKVPQLTHGLCPSCYDVEMADLG